MRLDFNLVVVDDDWDDQDRNTNIKELIYQIGEKVKTKGFVLQHQGFSNPEDALRLAHNRVDLFLSDNNLGNNPHHSDPDKDNAGIDYYLRLRSEPYLCDFVLYTRSKTDEIIKKLIEDLDTKKDPNLFSRFTFVSREDGQTNWHIPVLKLIDYSLTKREELNTLRAIYAQYVSRIDARLKAKFAIAENINLHDTIEKIPQSLGIDKNFLHEVRLIRNGLMHNDEEYCTVTNQYTVKYYKLDKTEGIINENDLEKYRAKLNQAYSLVMDLP